MPPEALNFKRQFKKSLLYIKQCYEILSKLNFGKICIWGQFELVFQPDIRAGCSKSLYSLELGHEASSPDLSSSPLAHQEDESMSGTEENNCRADTPGSERSTPEEGRGFRREYSLFVFSYIQRDYLPGCK